MMNPTTFIASAKALQWLAGFLGAAIPVGLIGLPWFVMGFMEGFSLDCTGKPPGVGSGFAAALFAVVLGAPITIPAIIIGVVVCVLGVRQSGLRFLARLAVVLVAFMIVGGLAGTGFAAVVRSNSTGSLPMTYFLPLIAFGTAGGGLLGLIAMLVVVLVRRRRIAAAKGALTDQRG